MNWNKWQRSEHRNQVPVFVDLSNKETQVQPNKHTHYMNNHFRNTCKIYS